MVNQNEQKPDNDNQAIKVISRTRHTFTRACTASGLLVKTKRTLSGGSLMRSRVRVHSKLWGQRD